MESKILCGLPRRAFPSRPARSNGQGTGVPGVGDAARWKKGDPGFLVVWSGRKSAENREEVLKELRRRGVEKVRIFITDDLPRVEGVITRIFPQSEWQLCVLHAVRDSLNKVRKGDRQGVAEAPKAVLQGREHGGNRGGVEEVAGWLGRQIPQGGGEVGTGSLGLARVPEPPF